MRRAYWAGAAAALIALCAALLLHPWSGQSLERARAAVEAAAPDAGYVCPVDFAALQAENRDIYAWLYIPGAEINEPLVQREDDSRYYLTHDSLGRKNASGALFTESAYNQKDFSDPAVVVYGKNTVENRLFGNLQAAYSSAAGLEEYGDIVIYLPEKAVHYRVFAAAPFQSCHLLHYFNFSCENRFRAFLQAVDAVKTVDANWNRAVGAAPGDPLLILSTTRLGDPDMSYLVLARRA